MKYTKTFVGAVLAGISIGLGGLAFLPIENKTLGGVLFPLARAFQNR